MFVLATTGVLLLVLAALAWVADTWGDPGPAYDELHEPAPERRGARAA